MMVVIFRNRLGGSITDTIDVINNNPEEFAKEWTESIPGFSTKVHGKYVEVIRNYEPGRAALFDVSDFCKWPNGGCFNKGDLL